MHRGLLAALILLSGAMCSQSKATEGENPAHYGTVKLAWDFNSEPDIAGYRVHFGPESGTYTETEDVGYQVHAELTDLPIGATYFCTVTIYNLYGLESPYSNEISFTVKGPAEAPKPPIDSDCDGLSDFFEASYGGGTDLYPFSDLDGDGLSALVEFVHGLNPTVAQVRPRGGFGTFELDGVLYMCLHYLVDPLALELVAVHSERSTNDLREAGWNTGETVQVSATPSEEYPGLLEIVERSLSPMTAQPREFLRLNYDVISPLLY